MSLRAEALAIASSALVVALVAIPLGLTCAWLARLLRTPVLPTYRKRPTRWTSSDVILLAFLCLVVKEALSQILEPSGLFTWLFGPGKPPDTIGTVAVSSTAIASHLEGLHVQHRLNRSTTVGLLLIPIIMVLFHFWKTAASAESVPPHRDRLKRFVADIAAGVFVWLMLAPLTFFVHFVVNLVMDQLGIVTDDHPLKRLPLVSSRDVLMLFLGACVVAPFFEEMAYRRVMIPWAAQQWWHAWILMAVASFMATTLNTGSSRTGPIILVMLMAGLLAIVQRWAVRSRRLPMRPASAVISTATLFAVMHSPVWPTPIPLVVLGLGLGWLVLRTKTVTAAIVTHGLFNAISVCYMLRSTG